MPNYITRFIRNDREPDEDYYYPSADVAIDHLELFRNDDSGLYKKIVVLQYNPEKLIAQLEF